MQQRDLSTYVLHTSSILLSNGDKKEFYNCHRSYNYIPKGNGIRFIKSQGSNKTGKACPSRMEVLVKLDGSVVVKYFKTHLGHSLDVGSVFLSKEVRAEIAGIY